jgi:hypothetical protein
MEKSLSASRQCAAVITNRDDTKTAPVNNLK